MTHARTYLAAAALGALVLGGGLGCRKPVKAAPPKAEDTAVSKLLMEGENLLKHKEWDAGRKTLRIIEERFPSTPEFPKAKLLIADSFFFGSVSTYPEALVEYQSFLSYFPRHERRDYAQYRIALCHYASIENAERDQSTTRQALEAFKRLLAENPGSPYAPEAKAKITQCWRRLAESELMVGIFYAKSNHFNGAETRLKQLLETYPDYVDRERAYYYLGEAMRQKRLSPLAIEQFQKNFLERIQKDDLTKLSKEELAQFSKELKIMDKTEIDAYRAEARSYYQKLVESYPDSSWAFRAKDRLLEMGQTQIKEELDS
ncbi:MAG: bamD [Holophagaceae bacterium]|nr:bamD [Holophagaceae bacterium]